MSNKTEQQLTDTEQTALASRIDKLNGEYSSPIPYVNAFMDEFTYVLTSMSADQKSPLIKVRNELVLARLGMEEVLSCYFAHVKPAKEMDDAEIIHHSLRLAGVEGVIQILTKLQEAIDARLFEITHCAIGQMDIQGGNDDRTLN